MHTGDFIVYIKTDNIYKDIDEDFETKFDTSDYKLECNSIERPFLKGKIVTGLMTDELGGKIMTKFVVLRAKTYSYLIDDGCEDKKAKEQKKFYNKNLKFENYRNCLQATQLENKKDYLLEKKQDLHI